MNLLLQYFKQYNRLSAEAEDVITKITSIIELKKNAILQPLVIPAKRSILLTKELHVSIT